MSRAQLTSTVEQNTGGAVAPFVAGKNKIINGDFSVWQRGTSFTGFSFGYTADRYNINRDGSGATVTVSQQAFTAGTAPVAGYEGTYFYRFAQSVAGSGGTYNLPIAQRIEDCRVFAGQTVTVSFWAKADAARTVASALDQVFGSGGSATNQNTGSNITLSTSWARYSQTFTLASVAGKTIGSGSYLEFKLYCATNTVQTLDFWGVQVEAGSVATPFTTASNTFQGELSLCQRYYWRLNGTDVTGSTIANICTGYIGSSSAISGVYPFPVQMRVAPSIAGGASTNFIGLGGGSFHYPSTFSAQGVSKTNAIISLTASGYTAYQAGALLMGSTSADYLEHSAEL